MTNHWFKEAWALGSISLRGWVAFAMAAMCGVVQASIGITQISATSTDGPVTVFYSSSTASHPIKRGPFVLDLAEDGAPLGGNGRLIVISHGSGSWPWVHTNLARTLVDSGFVVAFPEHRADNHMDDSNPGPDSWTIRPAEVSRAIDTVGRDARFAPLLQLDKVGVYGISAGGHTALELAGGRWSPARFKEHCEANLVEDFQACVGLITRLNGDMLDGVKKRGALVVIRYRFGDATMRSYTDPRVAAVIAGVPFAADFDMASFETLIAPLGLITAGQDRWLVPRFHSERVLSACKQCELIAHVPTGGHGALLSPLPSGLKGLLGELINDPPGFDRGQMLEIDRRSTAFFVEHLLTSPSPPIAQSQGRASPIQ
jgi:predicted dienelactone hydrolase